MGGFTGCKVEAEVQDLEHIGAREENRIPKTVTVNQQIMRGIWEEERRSQSWALQ